MAIKTYNTSIGQDIFDVANLTLAGFDNIYAGIIAKNSGESIVQALPTVMTYDDFYYNNSTIQIQLDPPATNIIGTIAGKQNQSIYDICLQCYGSLDYMLKLMVDSDIISLNELSAESLNFIFDTTVGDVYTVNSANSKGYVFATLFEDINLRITEDAIQRTTENNIDRIV